MQKERDALVAEMTREFAGFRIVPKRGNTLSHLIHVVLKVLTLGGQRQYLTHYHTVLGNTLYVPDRWEDTSPVDQMITLRHERVHLRQRRRYGDVILAFLYIFPIFPIGLAYGRARLEWEAYRETLQATADLQGWEAARDPSLREHITRQFTSSAYAWMWPFSKSIDKWYESALDAIEAEMRESVDQIGSQGAR